jgi:ABC-type glycerol-3-phosphate transport system substrate-binding protein
MRARLSGFFACATAGSLVLGLSACSGSEPAADGGKITITVSDMPPTTQEKSRQQFLDRVAKFEQANPDIKIEPSEAQWDAKTFAARLAGGQLETVFIVPLTEPQGMIKRRQIADITDELKALPHAADFDERALSPATDSAGRHYGLPTSEFALSLVYNRELFTKAGLDPDNPPKTWDDVRVAAKAIFEKTGIPGYAQPTTTNGGGWLLTAMTYTRGGRMEKEQDGKWVPAFNDAPTLQTLQWLKEMRWTDNAMGTQMVRASADVLKDFSAGKVGMHIATPSTYGDHITKYNGNPEMFGVTALPSGGTNATLIGGKMAVVSPKASHAERAAAVKWIDYYYLQPKYDVAIAESRAQTQAADKLPVGIPAVPFYGPAVDGPVTAAVNKHANVPVKNFAPFLAGSQQQEFVPEPTVAAQDIYAALDTVMQAVLTRQNADPAAELAKAEDRVKPLLERAQ